MKKDLREQLLNREIRTPDPFLAWMVDHAFRYLAKKANVTFDYGEGVKEHFEKQVIVLSQHCSKDEYIYTIAGFPKKDMHVVIGYHNFFQKYVYHALIRLGTISKYLYTHDLQSVKSMLKVIKAGESILLFPEGIQSTSGSTHPINPGTMHFLMRCKLPVILCTSHGSYLTRPRWSAKKRHGRMTFSYQLLFRPEDYQSCTEDELYDRLLAAFRYNEFEYNRKARIPFKGECENIEGLDKIIFKCPHCGAEFAFSIEGRRMTCTHCGYAVEMDEYYDLHPVDLPLCFEDVDRWYKWQREQVREQVRREDFLIRCPVKALDINTQKLQNTPCEVGEGELTIRDCEIVYRGSYKGEADSVLTFDIRKTPSFPFSPGDGSIDLFYDGRYYCFRPLENPLQTVKWMLAVEEIHNRYDKVWESVSKDVYG